MEIVKSQSKGNVIVKKVFIYIAVILIIALIAFPTTIYVRLSTEGRLKMREARNAKFYLQMRDVEFYANGETIANPKNKNGLKTGLEEDLKAFMECDCKLTLTGYNYTSKEVTDFIYENGKYQVVYTTDENNKQHWKVRYIFDVVEFN